MKLYSGKDYIVGSESKLHWWFLTGSESEIIRKSSKKTVQPAGLSGPIAQRFK